ncbi:MAG: pectinesterase [Polyangiaceae bacterium]|nr:pectinesterase [Polyangiaceae bacterium]
MKLSHVGSLFAFGCLLSTASACGGDDDSGGSAGSGGATGGSGGAAGAAGTGGVIDGPPAEGPITKIPKGWNEIAPGGKTACGRGDKFRFWVRPGAVNRVVVEFRGGGGCWDGITCHPDSKLFEETANPEPWVADEKKAVGIYDHSRADNPFKDWHHVYISYCTGDVHWGNSTQTYDPGGVFESTVQHKGAVNAQAALDWVYENVPTPDKALVTGCSAGGYGAAFWSPMVKDHYKSSKIYHFSDSSAGIITDTFFEKSFPAWNVKETFPTMIGVDPSTFKQLSELYIGIGKKYPDMFLSQFNTAYDATQAKYFVLMGGKDATEWSQKMQTSVGEIKTATPGFRSYLGADYQHCVIDKDSFYDFEVGGQKLVTWLADAVADKSVKDVSCTYDNCGAPKPAQ